MNEVQVVFVWWFICHDTSGYLNHDLRGFVCRLPRILYFHNSSSISSQLLVSSSGNMDHCFSLPIYVPVGSLFLLSRKHIPPLKILQDIESCPETLFPENLGFYKTKPEACMYHFCLSFFTSWDSEHLAGDLLTDVGRAERSNSRKYEEKKCKHSLDFKILSQGLTHMAFPIGNKVLGFFLSFSPPPFSLWYEQTDRPMANKLVNE